MIQQVQQGFAAPLSPEDAQALSKSARDISDLDQRSLNRAQAGFERAYDVARRVTEGNIDPFSV
jgi:hypothetical protein